MARVNGKEGQESIPGMRTTTISVDVTVKHINFKMCRRLNKLLIINSPKLGWTNYLSTVPPLLPARARLTATSSVSRRARSLSKETVVAVPADETKEFRRFELR